MDRNTAVVLRAPNQEDPAAGLEVDTTLPVPQPKDGEVLVRMLCRPINPADIFSIMGVYPGFQPKETTVNVVPGLEGVGVVQEVGRGVEKVQPGQRVVGIPFNSVEDGIGTWQDFIIAKEENVALVPDAVPDSSAAQLWVNPMTVVGMLEELDIPKGEYLLQTAAGSVLGRQMITLAKHKGIKTINVVRREAQKAELEALGADHVVCSEDGSGLAEAVKEITQGAGAYGAIDAVGGSLFSAVASAVRPGGTAVIYGAMSGLELSCSIIDPLFRSVTIKGFWLVPWSRSKSPEILLRIVNEVFSLMESGIIAPFSGKTFELENVHEAIAVAISEARGGKVLLCSK